MPKPLHAGLFAAGAFATVLTLGTAQVSAQQHMGPGGPGMMQAQGPEGAPPPGGPMMGDRRGAAPDAGRGGRGWSHREGWRERRHARRRARQMEILDTDKDGKVSLAEIDGEIRRLLGAADVNGDGKLSADEFSRRGRWFLRLRTVSFFDMLDADGDGQLSPAELSAPAGRWFKRKDENKDKALSGEELNHLDGHHGRHSGRYHGRHR